MIGPDHAASLEPAGLQRLIRNVRNVEKALGAPEKRIMESEHKVRQRLAKSIVARTDIRAGDVITPAMLTVKGPGSGLKPGFIPRLVGVVAESHIQEDSLVPEEALQWRRA